MIGRPLKVSCWRWAALAAGLGLAGLLAWSTTGTAQQAPGPGGHRRDRDPGGPPPPDRLFRALDRDGDGTLSSEEIMNASESLKNLDDDQDGSLSETELRPPRGEGHRSTRSRGARGPTPAKPPATGSEPDRAGEQRVELAIRGGHDTDPRDRGRPVALVAGALSVSPEDFRTAFSRVRPAPAGTEPGAGQVRRNKAVLLAALEPLGVTNDELDRVSNYYRYNPGRDELWPVKAAVGYAIFRAGEFASLVITEPGSGYNSPPAISVPDHPELVFEAKLRFGPDLRKNGSVSSVTPARPNVPSRR
jgi:hypothetical protein